MNWERLDKELISFKVVWIHYKKDGPNEVNSIITCSSSEVQMSFRIKTLY
jgi:hypothetical protein